MHKSFRVVAVDMRGYGFSDHPSPSWWGSAEYDMETLVQDVRAMVPALGHQQCVLVCHDWGAAIGWQVVQRFPALFSHMVCMSMPHPTCWAANMGAAQLSKSWYIAFFNLPWIPELFVSRRNHFLTRKGVFNGGVMAARRKGAVQPDDIQAYCWNSSTPGTTTCALNYYRNLFTRNIIYSLLSGSQEDTLPTPVLSIIPDSDGAICRSTYSGQQHRVEDLWELRLTSESAAKPAEMCPQ